MPKKKPSDALKCHRHTFHLARYDPEGWEQARYLSLSENLREAQERASIAEREAEASKKLLRHREQEVSLVITHEGELLVHETQRLTACARNWRLQKPMQKIIAG